MMLAVTMIVLVVLIALAVPIATALGILGLTLDQLYGRGFLWLALG